MSQVCLDKYTKAQLISRIKIAGTKYAKKKELTKLLKPALIKMLANQMRKKSKSPKILSVSLPYGFLM